MFILLRENDFLMIDLPRIYIVEILEYDTRKDA
jgi:hypothetical protein